MEVFAYTPIHHTAKPEESGKSELASQLRGFAEPSSATSAAVPVITEAK
jgi:hypothetical protein